MRGSLLAPSTQFQSPQTTSQSQQYPPRTQAFDISGTAPHTQFQSPQSTTQSPQMPPWIIPPKSGGTQQVDICDHDEREQERRDIGEATAVEVGS